jgi:hypothetical protein
MLYDMEQNTNYKPKISVTLSSDLMKMIEAEAGRIDGNKSRVIEEGMRFYYKHRFHDFSKPSPTNSQKAELLKLKAINLREMGKRDEAQACIDEALKYID